MNYFNFVQILPFLITYCYIVDCTSNFLRGLNPSNKEHYNPSLEFKCLDGSKSIAFDRINDDYCDCSDGSDEPGTAACPNGVFYCMNEAYRPTILPSNRVADGVCDCCDGSDEFTGDVQCDNKCLELGEQLRENEEKNYAMYIAGNQIYKQYSLQGSAAKQEHKDKLVTLESDKQKLEAEKSEQDSTVKNLEGPEEEAKEKFKKAWEEIRDLRREERKRKQALELFHHLDIDSNGRVSLDELQQKPELDTDEDGHVSHEESVTHMAGEESSIEFVMFYERVWEGMDKLLKEKAQLKKDEQAFDQSQGSSVPSEEDDEEGRKDDEEEEEEDDEEEEIDADNEEEDDDKKDEDLHHKESEEDDDDEQMPPYDEDTQKYIDAAESARSVAREFENKLSSVDNEIEHASKIIDSDYGSENEFYSLSSECLELTDREYLYKLCPFDRTSQRNKQGGSETSLGYWTRWEDSSYRTMVFERGQGCWNGPDRSTKVLIECGPENKLISAEEPSRCEYHFRMSTPAACKDAPHHNTTPRQEL